MPTLIPTIGASTANAFVSEAEAEDYFDNRSNSEAWLAETDEDKKARALIDATRVLSLLKWKGRRVNSTQSLSWPRSYACNPDDPVIVFYEENIIPQRVKDATCELALEILRAGTTDLLSEDASINVIREKVDVLETEYSEPSNRKQGINRFPTVINLIRPLLEASTSMMFRRERA